MNLAGTPRPQMLAHAAARFTSMIAAQSVSRLRTAVSQRLA